MSGISSVRIRLRRSWLYRAATPFMGFARNKWFDVKHGVDTAGDVPLSVLTVDSPNRAHGIMYATINASLLGTIIDSLPIRPESYTFVDLGAGKGKVVLLAARRPFRKVIGVEFSEELSARARTNVARYRPASKQTAKVEIVHSDAAEFSMPEGPLVLYMYNPFREPVLRQVLENLRRSLAQQPRPVLIVYVNPELRSILEEWPELRIVESADWHVVYAANLVVPS
jgi:SAM-dependent methyltransferase